MAWKVRLLFEQHFPGHGQHIALCPYCGYPGGDGPPPASLTPAQRAAWGPMDAHEWLIKRNAGLPDEIIFCQLNMVLLHNRCHSLYGQTREMTKRIWEWKVSLGYDPALWLMQLQGQGHPVSFPEGVSNYAKDSN